jgi:hypothetical protein
MASVKLHISPDRKRWMNLGQVHCLASRALTLDLWLEITKSGKFVISKIIWTTKFSHQVLNLQQVKMAQQGKRMRFRACNGFAYHSINLVLLANSNRYEVGSTKFFVRSRALYSLEVFLCTKSELFWHTFVSVVCGHGSLDDSDLRFSDEQELIVKYLQVIH